MRRLVLSLVASCGIAALAACTGGYGFSTGQSNGASKTPDSIAFTNGTNQVNDFFVAPDGSAPIQVTAIALKGSGPFATVIPDVTFTWSTTYAPAGTKYPKGGSPNGNGTCGSAAQTPGINSLLQQGPAGGLFPLYAPFYSQLTLQPNSNPPNFTQQAATIYVGPPTIPPVGQPDTATLNVVPYATGSTNYCLYVYAKAVGSGVQGGTLVVVSDAP